MALGGTTWQINVHGGGVSSRAVDGNFNPDWGGASCMHTGNVFHAWWAVDLEDTYEISKVIVSTRNTASKYHYNYLIMSVMASQITALTIVYLSVYSGADQRKHQSSASLAFSRGIHPSPVNSPHKGPVTWKMFPFDDVIMCISQLSTYPGYFREPH